MGYKLSMGKDSNYNKDFQQYHLLEYYEMEYHIKYFFQPFRLWVA